MEKFAGSHFYTDHLALQNSLAIQSFFSHCASKFSIKTRVKLPDCGSSQEWTCSCFNMFNPSSKQNHMHSYAISILYQYTLLVVCIQLIVGYCWIVLACCWNPMRWELIPGHHLLVACFSTPWMKVKPYLKTPIFLLNPPLNHRVFLVLVN